MRMLLFLTIIVSGCSSYVKGIHRQIDRDEKIQRGESLRDPYAAYREQGFKHRKADRRPIKNPHSISALNPANDVPPPVRRDYRNGSRSSSQDFVDGGQSGSLWVSPQGSSLFTTEINRRVGDIVVVNVLDDLRNQISSELKRAFPAIRKAKSTDANKATSAAAPPPPPADGKADELETKVYDKISGVVAEEINKDYFLLRGKKEVVFRKEKRFIELQALVARKDIADNDTINSDKLVESRVIILR